MREKTLLILSLLAGLAMPLSPVRAAAPASAAGPPADEEQLPRKMHAAMSELPVVRVGQNEGDLRGNDHRVLQAAVDYVAGLGGGLVLIGEGVYVMRDSLHLRSHVTVRGVRSGTILRKAPAAVSALAMDGDFGEEQITLVDPEGFAVGDGVAIRDDAAGGFSTTVARITGRKGSTFSISRPLMADCSVSRGARAATVFPVISGYDLEGARVEDLIVDGNRDENVALNGCRGGGIFLYRGFGTVIQSCIVRRYHGDGISFQQSNDVQVLDCLSEDNAGLGIHPGSGSQRPRVARCTARNNGQDGLYLCWRVRHGRFTDNRFENNGRFGISIGHKDTDNLLRGNLVRGNALDGIMFRPESAALAGHRNRLEANVIEDNGVREPAAGIRIRGATRDVILRRNIIRDTRSPAAQTQTTGVRIDAEVGPLTLEENTVEATRRIQDERPKR